MARIGRERWLDEGLLVLARDGAEALSAELLAARLGVQPGLFTFHFGDRAGFEAALIAHWQARAEASGLFGASPTLDVGIRALARTSPAARAAVEAVDAERERALVEALRREHPALPEPRLTRLARLELAVFVGAAHWLGEPHDGRWQALEEDLAAALAALAAR